VKLTRLLFIVSLLTLSSIFAGAQSPTKVALFESDVFFDQKNGIASLVAVQKKLTVEMTPRLEELQRLNDRVEKLRTEIRNAAPAVATPAWLRDKNDEGSRILREIDFKQKEADIYREKLQRDLIDPEMVVVGREMIEFAKKRSIDVLIDQSRFSGTIFPVSPTSNITLEFIRDFNAKRAGVPIKQ